jgi:translation initiation factor IF-1
MPSGSTPERDEGTRVKGRVMEQLPSALYRVELQSEGRPQVVAHLSPSANLLRLRPGEAVLVELAAQDPGRGRIVARD